MLHLLIDTCVWLELAKDHRQQPILACLETLVEDGQVALIVPQTVVDEFARNKERIVREGAQSLSGLFRRVKDTVDRFGASETKAAVVRWSGRRRSSRLHPRRRCPGDGETYRGAVRRH